KSITINSINNSGNDKFIESYDIVKDYYVSLDEKPLLPKEVNARYSDGTTEAIRIEWNEYDEDNLKTPQIFKVTGRLEDTDIPVVVNIHVVGDVVSMENISTFTYAGNEPTLPKTVKGYLANGTESEEFVVSWNFDNIDFTTENTIVFVPGTVSLLNKTYNVTASVRVVPALKAARNIAINKSNENNDIPRLSQSPIQTADNLNSINNGITNGGEDVNERWTNWRERTLISEIGEPKGAYVQFDWNNKYNIDRLDLWLFTDNLSARIPKKVEISYKNENGEYVVQSHTNTTEVSHSAGETTYFLDKSINTDSIRIYMQQPQVGNCIGLTEVKVYEYVEKEIASDKNTLKEIKINGNNLEDFDPEINEYEINLDKLPEQVEANAEDNRAVTILPIHNNKSLIFVRAEDGSKNMYTVNYILPIPKEYVVTVNNTEGGSTTGQGKYEEGKEVNLIAKADEGHKFVGWFDVENKEISKEEIYRFVVKSDIEVTAKFEKISEVIEPGKPEEPNNPEEPSKPQEPNKEAPKVPEDSKVGESENKANQLPTTGTAISSTQIILLATILIASGLFIAIKRKAKVK
ncbi:MAG: Ig-like domain-containing protein, partial [Bacilli bacterium]